MKKVYFLVETICFSGNDSCQRKQIFLVEDFLLVEVIPLSGIHLFQWRCSFQWKPFILEGAVLLSVFSVQWKSCLLVKAVSFRGNYSFQWKPFLLVEVLPFSGKVSIKWQPLLLMEVILFSGSLHFRGNHSFQGKRLLLIETITLSRSHSLQWKPFLLVEAIPLSGRHSLY